VPVPEDKRIKHFQIWITIYKHGNEYFLNSRKNFCHIRTVHLDTIKVIYSPTDAQVIVLKTILLPKSATCTNHQGPNNTGVLVSP
jgi:hypothetical protein